MANIERGGIPNGGRGYSKATRTERADPPVTFVLCLHTLPIVTAQAVINNYL